MSFNGRTLDFGSGYVGSIPTTPTIHAPSLSGVSSGSVFLLVPGTQGEQLERDGASSLGGAMSKTALIHGDCVEVMRKWNPNVVSAVVTDPPYGLGFMGKEWDTLSRKSVTTSEGQQIQEWNKVWATEVLRVLKPGGYLLSFGGTRTYHRLAAAIEDAGFEIRDCAMWVYSSGFPKSLNISKSIEKIAAKGGPNDADLHSRWSGWGTSLKPSWEPIVIARKPLEGTVADNVLLHGTGGLNIDASRVPTEDSFGGGAKARSGFVEGYEYGDGWTPGSPLGRWPANVIHDGSDEVMGLFPATKSRTNEGSAARFFYCAKANKAEREIQSPSTAESITNIHPTVKPLELMKHLLRLVSTEEGIILDPFAGSGTTIVAAKELGFTAVGIEQNIEYISIARARLGKI